MQRSWRRFRQRTELENDSADSSSDSDVVKVEEIRPHSQELKAEKAEKAWECPMCTFLNENTSASRCKLCESVRPGQPRKTRKLSQWLSQPTHTTEHRSVKKKQSSGAQEPIEVIDSSDSGNSDDGASVTSTASFNDGAASRRRSEKMAADTMNQGLWADLYAPETVDDLCVNKKKVQEISEWLERNASPISGVFQKRLLFLCGPPGSGKSTAVRCIARKLGLLIKEWEDNSAAGKLNHERMLREDFWTPQVSSVDDFSDFIHRSSAYGALPVATSRHTSTIGRKRRLSNTQQVYGNFQTPSVSAGQVILIESWPQSWSKDKSLYEEKLQRVYQHVVDPAGGCRYPVVCIYSDVQGSKIDLDHMSRKFSREVIHSPLTSVININAVTSAQLKKHLSRAATQESCPCQPADIQNIIDSSNGDMRHALNMLQLLQNPNVKKHRIVLATATKKRKRKNGSSVKSETSSATSSSARDPFLSDFHVVGKLLHGKMLQNKSADESALKNDVDYDQILNASAMPLDRILGLVHENSIAYFSQVEDLSGALELMSLCEVMVAESYSGASSSEAVKRSRDVAQAILTRTIAVTNENPAPKAFRPITRPRTYTTNQRIVSRRDEMLVATRGGEHGLQHACTGDVFAFEVEPFLTIMDRVGGPAIRQNTSTFAMDTLSLKEEVDDEIENSDDEW
ncbi:Rad17 P-loop domain [Phytophthora infestans]|uniref:Rad17 P-loop domain n=1 Tax=Phytophthora infestans TaxID=4787 RepID=A0A833WHS0_PHYIN|nr:Rad17 P-loop domain [Phytophthora infestans]